MIKTCNGIYARDSLGFEMLLEEWIQEGWLDSSTKTLEVSFLPWETFPDFDQTWGELALERLQSKGYEVEKLRFSSLDYE